MDIEFDGSGGGGAGTQRGHDLKDHRFHLHGDDGGNDTVYGGSGGRSVSSAWRKMWTVTTSRTVYGEVRRSRGGRSFARSTGSGTEAEFVFSRSSAF